MRERGGSTSPRAVISRSALVLGAERAVRAAGPGVADLRRDAWGHGLIAAAHAVMGAGARAVRVDSPGEAEALRLEGIVATLEEEPDLDPTLLFGLPGPDGKSAGRPAMRMTGRVLSVKNLEPGDGVSYGYLFRAEESTTVVLASGGYSQGLVRALGNAVKAEIDGVLYPIVGRIAMDVCVIDVGHAPVAEGETVTFFGGSGPAAEGLAEWSRVTGLSVPELVAVVGQQTVRGWET